MTISAVVSIGAPVFLFLYFRKKYGSKFLPMILGIAGFTIFALVLESSIHNIILGRFIIKDESPFLYVIYGIFMAGIFEESARFISFNILKKKYGGLGTALSYGIGHGGIEAILLAGLAMISTIISSLLINSGNIEAITGNLQGDALTTAIIQIEVLRNTAPFMFLVSGIERLFAIVIQLSLSVVVFYSVYSAKKVWLFPLAILIHAVIDIPAAAMQAGLLKSIVLAEVLVFVCAVGAAVFAKFLHDKLKATENPSGDIKDSPSLPDQNQPG
jgi:uncharacterized membrane protein YhfC